MASEKALEVAEARKAGQAIAKAAAIMARLRGPDGCPWDREQTFDSIKRHTLEETYEVFDAIERRAWPELRDELGDLLLQVLFYAQMAAEAGHFTLADVGEALSGKLIRRHPHVFGEAKAADTDAVLNQWEQIKRSEKMSAGEAPQGALDSIPRSMPAMVEAAKLGGEAAKNGFDWPDAAALLHKLPEEIAELRVEIDRRDADATEGEIGDLLFTAVNLARHLKVDPESALRRTNAKFRSRYSAMEALAGGGAAFGELPIKAKDALWNRAKNGEGQGPGT